MCFYISLLFDEKRKKSGIIYRENEMHFCFSQLLLLCTLSSSLTKENITSAQVVSAGLPYLSSCISFLESLFLFSWTVVKADHWLINEVIIDGAKLIRHWEYCWQASLALWRCHTINFRTNILFYEAPHSVAACGLLQPHSALATFDNLSVMVYVWMLPQVSCSHGVDWI